MKFAAHVEKKTKKRDTGQQSAVDENQVKVAHQQEFVT